MKWMVVYEQRAGGCDYTIGCGIQFSLFEAETPTECLSKFLMSESLTTALSIEDVRLKTVMTGGPMLQLPGINYADIKFGEDSSCEDDLPYYGCGYIDEDDETELKYIFIFPLAAGIVVDMGELQNAAQEAEAAYNGVATEVALAKEQKAEKELLERLAEKHGKKLIDE